MQHPQTLSIQDFSYELPEHRIAKYPLENRDESKLLVYKNGSIERDIYAHLDQHLPADTLLIFNNTKVIEARLLFTKSTGSIIELFCLEPGDEYADITSAMLQKQRVVWKCLVGGAKKWKEEILIKSIVHNNENFELRAKKIEKRNDYFLIELSWSDASLSFAEVLHDAGVIPLPPYLKRQAEDKDKETYQTIYAKFDGSVAAPTAGLHFTQDLFEKLKAKQIESAFVTLHVGAGTFKPVTAETMQQHEMHAEFIEVEKRLIESLLHHLNGTIVTVGTTSLRTVESLYWLGVKAFQQQSITIDELHVLQWEPYEIASTNITAEQALQALLKWMFDNNVEQLITKTQIIIAPGYQLKIAKGLITNFHQPQSTLLLLVAALIGEKWRSVYQYALDNNFRFLSYGDGSLLWADNSTSC